VYNKFTKLASTVLVHCTDRSTCNSTTVAVVLAIIFKTRCPQTEKTSFERDRTMVPKQQSSFPIPASLHDLERDPYNLLPYPFDFNDEDEAARADSFLELVHQVEQGNRTLSAGGIALFESIQDQDDAWMDEDRVQALYTLVR
jgi:hypothetical protein